MVAAARLYPFAWSVASKSQDGSALCLHVKFDFPFKKESKATKVTGKVMKIVNGKLTNEKLTALKRRLLICRKH